MDQATINEYERFAIGLAYEAGALMTAACGKNTSIESKASPADLVTETDTAVERLLFGRIKERYPGHKTIGEEATSAGVKAELTNAPTWIIDPIDGTMNFVHTFPFTCVSIGLTVDKKPVLGVVYSPFLNKLYTAKLGCGAFCNGKPIRVRACKSLEEGLMIAELGGDRDDAKKDAVFKNLQAVVWRCHGLRALGSAALNTCYIAEGFADGYWEFGLHCWDMAACSLILTEAGGVVMDTQGGPLDIMSRRFLGAGSQNIAQELSAALPVHLELERD